MARVKKIVKYVQPTAQEKELWAALIEQADEINKLKDAICPKVAARLTALEKAIQTKAQGRAHDRLGNPLPRSTQEQPLAIKYTLLLQAVDAVFASVNGSAGPHHARVQLRALDALSHIRKQL